MNWFAHSQQLNRLAGTVNIGLDDLLNLGFQVRRAIVVADQFQCVEHKEANNVELVVTQRREIVLEADCLLRVVGSQLSVDNCDWHGFTFIVSGYD